MPTSPQPPARLRPALFSLGLLLLGVCVAMSLMLTMEHLVGLSLPGCGAGSPCAEASASVWGKVPYVGWPVSFIGLAYFLAMCAAWIGARGRVPTALRVVVRLGVIVSVGFVVVMVRGGYVCPYCLVTHIANVVFWVLVELSARSRAAWRPAAAFLATFALASAVLGLVELRWSQAARAVAEKQMQESGAAILSASQQPPSEPPTQPAAASNPAAGGFTGRYHLGPQEAAIRIVVFSDYMCKGCHLLELELKQLFEQHADLSLSVKQWPGDVACNPYGAEGKHVNSCAAARAAEAAGLLHGNDGFWQMHFWLFDQSGRFTTEELRAKVAEFGYDADEFERVWQGPETLRLVQGDIAEGFGLGVRSTPTVYINGVEFKGWDAPLALTRVVDKLLAANLPVRSAAHDHPLSAVESYVADWRNSRVHDDLPAEGGWSLGPREAPLKIVIWGDYQQPNTALADGIIREFLTGCTNAQYVFRAYPLNPQCNEAAKEAEYAASCRAALAAYAAGRLGGPDAYWKMHDWLLKNQAGFSDEAVRAAAPGLGLDPGALLAAMDDPATLAAVQADAAAGAQAGLQHSPLMFVDGKLIPRWLHGDQPMLRPILDAAAK